MGSFFIGEVNHMGEIHKKSGGLVGESFSENAIKRREMNTIVVKQKSYRESSDAGHFANVGGDEMEWTRLVLDVFLLWNLDLKKKRID